MKNKVLSLMLVLTLFVSFVSPFVTTAKLYKPISAKSADVYYEDFEYKDPVTAKTEILSNWSVEDTGNWGTANLKLSEEAGGNSYMHLQWVAGRLFRYKNIKLVSPYTFSGRFRVKGNNHDGGVIFFRTDTTPIKVGAYYMNEYETDGYNDGTFSNGVGATGVYLKPQGTKMYVFVRTSETLDAIYTKGLGRKFFVVDMPGGIDCEKQFFNVSVKDNGSKMEIFVENTLIATVEYSNLVGGLYTNAIMKDAQGNIKHNITNARIAASDATIAMACRGEWIDFDDIEIINKASQDKDFYLTKSEYTPDEDLVIKYQNTTSKDWVAIVKRGDSVTAATTLMWTYTEGTGTKLLPTNNYTTLKKLELGEYDAVLCKNDLYSEVSRVSFSVKEDASLPAPAFWWFEDENTVNSVITNNVRKIFTQTSMQMGFGVADDGSPVTDPWIELTVPADRPLDTTKYPIMSFLMKKSAGSPNTGDMYIRTTNSGAYGSAGTNLTYTYQDVDTWQIVNVDMTKSSAWKDNLLSLRLDVFGGCTSSDKYEIAYVAFFKSTDAANAFAGKFYITGPALVFNYQKTVDLLVPTNQTKVKLEDKYARLSCDDNANDPNVSITFDTGNTFDAGKYKFAVYRMKSSSSNDTICKLYFGAGTQTAPAESSTATFTVKGDGKWHNYIVNMSAGSWTGNANFIRMDYFDSLTGGDKFTGEYMDIESITFFNNIQDAKMFTGGYPAIRNTVAAYDTTAAKSAVQVMGSNVLATKIEVNGYLNSLAYLEMPTWAGIKTEFTFRLYKWDTNYEKTIASAPIYEKIVFDHKDNSNCVITFNKPLEPGRYMAVITNGKAGEGADGKPGGAAGCWATPAINGVITFFNGQIQTVTPKMTLDVYDRLGLIPIAKEDIKAGPHMKFDCEQNFEYTKNRFDRNDVDLSYNQGLHIDIKGGDPIVLLPAKDLNLDCSKYKAIVMYVITDKAGAGNFYFSTTETALSEATNIPFKYKGTGSLEKVYVNLNSKGNFKGNLKDLRFDVYSSNVDANYTLLGYVFFGSVEEAMVYGDNIADYTISSNKTVYTSGEAIEVTVSGNGSKDWVGIVPKGAIYTVGDTSSKWWAYVPENGKVTLTKECLGDITGNNLPAGEYDLVYMLNDGYFELGRTSILVDPYKSSFFTGVGADPVVCTTNLAVQFNTTTSFTELITYCPSWSNNIGNLTFTLYKWDTSYKKTLAGTALATYEHVNYPDSNPGLSLKFDAQPAGEYLLYIENTSETLPETVGCWASGNFAGAQSYNNGVPIDSAIKMVVAYTSQPTGQYNPLTKYYNTSVGQITGGTVTLDSAFAFEGDTVKVTVTPGEGMRLKEGSLKVNDTVITNYEFVMPNGDATVTAEFEQIPQTEPVTNPKTNDTVTVIPLFVICFTAAVLYIVLSYKSKKEY